MSSRAESKTASQFLYLTSKLKDKIQSQKVKRFERIKHTPSLRVKPPDLNLEHENTIEHKSVCGMADQERAVVSSLQYFKALVDRLGVDKMVQDQSVVGRLMGGASGGVLEAVQTLVQLEPRLHSSKTISSCLTRLYQSVAQLIRWTDQVMLQGVAQDNKDSKAGVTKEIRRVLDGVKELVRLASERKEGCTPISPPPFQSQAPVEQTSGFKDQVSSDQTFTCWNPGTPAKEAEEEEELRKLKRTEEQIVLAPPKPPMPVKEPRPQVAPSLGLSPPALPPKKRHSLPCPAPCRIAIVAPMRRESDVNRPLPQEDEEYFKRCSSSSADSSIEKSHCEEDPDYEFLHTDLSSDLSSSESLSSLPPPSSFAPPPALPEKRRVSATGNPVPQVSTSFRFEPPPQEESPAPHDDAISLIESLSSPLSPSKTPPPLPEKKRHIHQYLQFCSTYSGQSPAMFYQPSLTLDKRYSSRQREVENTYQFSHLDIHLDNHDPDPAPSDELPPAPFLPPKKKQPAYNVKKK
ncbi:rap guanine nucleotide exchange factor 1-like [Notolabrus celidotus]|uniref:rap guanine nucleotide exchange factor 1-like n=1 Tax=Notolabrus celidotus TaxID=1203425 RepID=UPI00148F8D87|nr:rap guanine nucleotide exchange factor 1-like [Notolabrus celidotus]